LLAAPDAVGELPAEAAHHALHVLRLRAGAALRVFDGAGNEFEARIEALGRRRVRIRVGGRVAPRSEPALRIVLAAAPLKGDIFDLVVQKATEMGVSAIWPVVSAHTEAGGRTALSGARLERWQKVAASAAAQSGRAIVPEVVPPAPFPALFERPFEGLRLLFDESCSAAHHPLPQLAHAPAAVQLLIGPAGGWTPEEARIATQRRGCVPVSLGPRVLRAETAALVAIAAVQVLWGDLRPAPRATSVSYQKSDC
jgi:16S rRNA (uracil1498-N3)-methyltransferase